MPVGLMFGAAVLVATGVDGSASYGSVQLSAVVPALFDSAVSGELERLHGTDCRGRSSVATVTCTITGLSGFCIVCLP